MSWLHWLCWYITFDTYVNTEHNGQDTMLHTYTVHHIGNCWSCLLLQTTRYSIQHLKLNFNYCDIKELHICTDIIFFMNYISYRFLISYIYIYNFDVILFYIVVGFPVHMNIFRCWYDLRYIHMKHMITTHIEAYAYNTNDWCLWICNVSICMIMNCSIHYVTKSMTNNLSNTADVLFAGKNLKIRGDLPWSIQTDLFLEVCPDVLTPPLDPLTLRLENEIYKFIMYLISVNLSI